jgi:hypothetical protein
MEQRREPEWVLGRSLPQPVLLRPVPEDGLVLTPANKGPSRPPRPCYAM